MIRHSSWAIDLVLGLAIFDIIGEFYAQGTLAINITISFLVACFLLILAVKYKRRQATRIRHG